jgi:membrane protease YdiL (CAAX protease family)
MDMKKTLGAIVASFVVQYGGDYLLHGVILKSSYADTVDLWRSDADMMHRMWVLILAQVIFAIAAVLIYQRGVEKKAWIGQGIRFGILLALVAVIPNNMIWYVVVPMPHQLALHSALGDGILAILVGLVIAGICQPKQS